MVLLHLAHVARAVRHRRHDDRRERGQRGEPSRSAFEDGPPEPPAWVAGLPLIGQIASRTPGRRSRTTPPSSSPSPAQLYRSRCEKSAGRRRDGGARRHPAARTVDLHRVLLFRDGDAIMRTRARRDRAASPVSAAQARVSRDATVRGVVHRHPRHRARPGRADGDRTLDRGHQGRTAAWPRHVLSCRRCRSARRWCGCPRRSCLVNSFSVGETA